jgi:uncharacterized protein YraI
VYVDGAVPNILDALTTVVGRQVHVVHAGQWGPPKTVEHIRIASVAEAGHSVERLSQLLHVVSQVVTICSRVPGFAYPTGREFVPRGRHRVEPVGRPLPRLLRPVVAAGIGAALLGVALVVTLAVTLWPNSGGDVPPAQAVAAADEGRWDAAADAVRTATAFRAEERTSRDRTDSPRRPAPVEPTSADKGPKPVPAVVGQLWVTTDVNIRSSPSAGHDRIGSLKAGARVNITGVTKSGWTQVVTDGRAGWVRSIYLSTSKPKPQPKPQPKSASPGVSYASCSISSSIEVHLTSNARSVYRAVCAAFGGSVSAFGGYRAGDPGDHGSGRAVDIMVSGEPGWGIARYVQAHSRELGVTYVIYEQKIWLAGNPTSQWKLMEDRGSRTANHYDHVHVSVS